MSNRELFNILRVPGAVYTVATGGVLEGLGRVLDVNLSIVSRRVDLFAEEFGGALVDSLEGSERVDLVFGLRVWSDAVIEALFSSATTGTDGRETLSRTVGTTSELPIGGLASARAIPLVFLPDRPAVHPSVYFPAALPRPVETAMMRLSQNVDLIVPAVFSAIPDANGSVYEVGFDSPWEP